MTGSLFDEFKEEAPGAGAIKRLRQREEGRRLRDKGTEAVMAPRPVFKELAARVIKDMAERRVSLTAESVQTEFLAKYPGCPPPHHNAWGAAILGASRRGIIKPSGRYVQTVKPASHARRIQVWEPTTVAA